SRARSRIERPAFRRNSVSDRRRRREPCADASIRRSRKAPRRAAIRPSSRASRRSAAPLRRHRSRLRVGASAAVVGKDEGDQAEDRVRGFELAIDDDPQLSLLFVVNAVEALAGRALTFGAKCAAQCRRESIGFVGTDRFDVDRCRDEHSPPPVRGWGSGIDSGHGVQVACRDAVLLTYAGRLQSSSSSVLLTCGTPSVFLLVCIGEPSARGGPSVPRPLPVSRSPYAQPCAYGPYRTL